ncbi:MAG: acetylxylan esterase [Sedimentisphaerales bacterium]|nr:acetylxylan esterase [Sedimentisphaerales bacterium]
MTGRKTNLTEIVVLTVIVVAMAGCGRGRLAVLPGADQLPVIEELPNPFLFSDGSTVKTPKDWLRRREEIKAMMLYYQYGHMPPAPRNVKAEILSSETIYGGATKKHILLSMGPKRQIKVNLGMIVPNGDGPFPIILKNEGKGIFQVPIAEEIVKRGYIVADYARTDLDPDEPNNVGPAQAAYPDYDWATLAVWAWGGMRAIDYLEALPFVDKDKIVFTGHSRGGKTALLAGALDERIDLVVPNGSGCGGAGCYRFEAGRAETLDDITKPSRFAYWFVPRFRDFAAKETLLPFDQHFLKALVAPRALLSTDALDDIWANPFGTQQSYRGAVPVFEFLGASEKLGIHYRRGRHDQNEEDWRALVDFADMVFFDKAPPAGRNFDELPFEDAPKPFSWSPPRAGR